VKPSKPGCDQGVSWLPARFRSAFAHPKFTPPRAVGKPFWLRGRAA
jgi:hypothetical protein